MTIEEELEILFAERKAIRNRILTLRRRLNPERYYRPDPEQRRVNLKKARAAYRARMTPEQKAKVALHTKMRKEARAEAARRGVHKYWVYKEYGCLGGWDHAPTASSPSPD